MILFGPTHLTILAMIALVSALLVWLFRSNAVPHGRLRVILGMALAANELVWWFYRYSREGVHIGNLPLHLCDAGVWLSVLACLTGVEVVVEFAYFTGLAGAGMALFTPNLIAPWPQYPAVAFFLSHGGIVIVMSSLVFGTRLRLVAWQVWRSFGLLLLYASAIGLFDWATKENYMFMRHTPEAGSPLDLMGPWPWYLAGGAAVGLVLFWLLWLPVRRAGPAPTGERAYP